MKIFKKLLLLCCIAIAAVAMTGCLGAEVEVKINKDGSGETVAAIGFDKAYYESLGETPSADELVLSKNGVDYYGTKEAANFADVGELNDVFAANAESAGEEASRSIVFSKISDGGFMLMIDTSTEIDQPDAETVAALDELEEQLFVNLKIEFPYTVTTPEELAGVAIDGTRLTVDVFELSRKHPDKVIKFISNPTNDIIANAPDIDANEMLSGKYDEGFEEAEVVEEYVEVVEEEAPVAENPFTDVKEEDWFYDAVLSMYNAGTVKGIGNGLFAPENTLTYAEFAQMLAREVSLESGEVNGYWAYRAVESCIKAGYIKDLGAITPENYDVPINREEAIVGMCRAYHPQTKADVSGIKVPDFESISPEYREEILRAYALGVTRGSDDIGTFLPKNSLTRAEICQLLVNVK